MTDDRTDAPPPPASAAPDPADPFGWLEDVLGERALAWVRERNAETEGVLGAVPGFAQARDALREVLDSKQQIPYVVRRGAWLYNFWRDAEHPRGLWRRATLEGFAQDEPPWQTVLDLDALAAAEGENWVWAGATAHGPDYRRALLRLSRGGADACVVREFDLHALRFVPSSEGGFEMPEAKCSVDWLDADTLFVASDFGPGSTTDSGYPRTVRRWRRGQPLAQAPTVFEVERGDISAQVQVDDTPGFERVVFHRAITFYTSRSWLLGADGGLQPVERPADASSTFWRDRLLFELRSDWTVDGTTFAGGSLLVADAAAWLRGERGASAGLQALFTPTPTVSLAGWTATRDTLLLNLLDDVASRLRARVPDGAGGWSSRDLPAPHPGSLSVAALHDPLLGADDPLAESFLLNYADFLTPDTLMLGDTRLGAGSSLRTLKSRPRFFDADGCRVERHRARSADGTEVPYFVVLPAAATSPDTSTDARPTLLYGYGGFEVSLQPAYSGTLGRGWLARGGVYVLANLRGGGEFGPAWHQAALREKRQVCFDDLAAVAEDLLARGIARPGRLAIQGGSNGGLLVGATLLQRPELFGAVVCQVPLLDMRRYHRLLAGASWMAEYGDPDDPDDWAFLSRYSPYQVAQALPASKRLPPLLLTTSTRDDRVHPGHARKMAALLRAQGREVLYWENLEGGHGGAADNAQRAQMLALENAFLRRCLG